MLALQVTLTTSPGLLMISAGAGDTLKLGPAVACKTRYKTEGSVIFTFSEYSTKQTFFILTFSVVLVEWNNTQWSHIETLKDQC